MIRKIGRLPFYFSAQKADNLKDLGTQVIFYAYLTIIISCIGLIPYRLITSDYFRIMTLTISLGLSLSGLLLLKKEKVIASYTLLAFFIYAMSTFLLFYDKITLTQFILVLSLFTLSNQFVTRNKVYILGQFFILLALLISILTYKSIPWLKITLLITAFYIFFYVVCNLIISLEERLQKAISKGSDLNSSLSEKNKKMQTYTNVMAHDIKAPLRSIKGFSYLVERELSREPLKKEHLSKHFSYITSSIVSLEKLIDDLMIQIKFDISELKIEEISMSDLISNEILKLKFQIESSNAQIELDDLGHLQGDKRSMEIVFSNLLSNALKYQPKNQIPIINITQKMLPNEVVFYVEDNGIGIEEDKLDKIFEPFKRLHSSSQYEGSGLGLSICKEIVEKHNGKLTLESQVNKGTKFRISIPIQKK